jgi:Zn-dependent M28 family amino/carboxypeptidase
MGSGFGGQAPLENIIMRRTLLFLFVAAFAFSQPASGQQSPFLPDTTYRVLVNEISGEISFEHIRWFTHWHRPTAGSEGFEEVAKYIEKKAREYGLEDVRRIDVRSDGPAWNLKSGELRVVEPFERRLAFSPEVQLSVADNSRAANIRSAELIDIGEGTEKDYEGKEVSGKVVLTSGPIGTAMSEAVWKRGALGVVAISTARATDHPDQITWMRVPLQSPDGSKQGTFGFVLSPREGQRLRRELVASPTPLKVSVKIDATISEAPFQSFVEAVIRGTETKDQDIVLTAHIQEEQFSANDDGSGLGNLLEIGRSLKKAIDEGRLPRPKRNIRFWWCDEIGGEEQYFAAFPDERKKILANVNQDMVGALQSAGSRVQFVTREPWSRASFLGDIVESIIVALVAGNTGYLAPGQVPATGFPADGMLVPGLAYTRPILSPLGTRERYDARIIPFHNNTDSMVFNMGVIGIPAVTFTNWPDDYIHSTGDDLWQVDATQLQRNAVAVAAITWFLATAGDSELPLLATHMHGRALERMSREARLAMEIIEAALDKDDKVLAEAYGRAIRLVRESARRERRALESARVLTSTAGAGGRTLEAMLAQLPTQADAEKRFTTQYTAVFQARRGPKAVPPTTTGQAAGEASAIRNAVPLMTDSVKAFLDARRQIERPRTLHPLMHYEALNYADGKRRVVDIFEAVAAQADAGGAWYYGTVELGDIEKVFESAEKAGIVKFVSSTPPTSSADGRPRR